MVQGPEGTQAGSAPDCAAPDCAVPVDGCAASAPTGDARLDAALALVDQALDIVCGTDHRMLSGPAAVALLTRFEQVGRAIGGLGHELVNRIAEDAEDRIHPGLSQRGLLSRHLRITRGEAAKRIRRAERLGSRRGLTGQVTPAQYAHLGAAHREGAVGDGHVEVIVKFLDRLPAAVSPADRDEAEQRLVDMARRFRPDEVAVAARRIEAHLDPDGTLDDERERARRRYLRIGPQGSDGLSSGTFCLDAPTRALFDSLLAKYARPGMCLPDRPGGLAWDDTATGTDPAQAAEDAVRDDRDRGQRNHDALAAMLAHLLAAGELGRHRGLPVTTIITMSLRELEAATGHALTGGGTSIPMRQAIAMAAKSRPHLLIFGEDGRPLYFGRARRLASEDQRLVLFATDRGCTYPGCDRPGQLCQVHHIDDWAAGGRTDIDRLTFACDDHHGRIGPGTDQWSTTIAPPTHEYPGRTRWHPPQSGQCVRGPQVNHFHHPEEYLRTRPPE